MDLSPAGPRVPGFISFDSRAYAAKVNSAGPAQRTPASERAVAGAAQKPLELVKK